MTLTQQYVIYIRADSLDEATEQSLHLSYWFLTRALQQHRGNVEFDDFALQVLALLQQYRHTYTSTPEAPEPVLED